jgi:hypothetical protein
VETRLRTEKNKRWISNKVENISWSEGETPRHYL